MVLIFGVNIPDQWVVKVRRFLSLLPRLLVNTCFMTQAALQYHFYGIGPNVAARLCAKLSIHPTARLSSLSHPTATALSLEMSKLKLDTDLKNELQANLERLRDLGTYRGRRHAQVHRHLPVFLRCFMCARISALAWHTWRRRQIRC